MSLASTEPRSDASTSDLQRRASRRGPCWKTGTVCVVMFSYRVDFIMGLSSADILLFPSQMFHRYEKSWDKSNKTKLLQDGLERAGRRDLAEKLRCLHWGQQKLSRRVELPSAFPFLITVHKTIHNQDALRRINDLNRRFT